MSNKTSSISVRRIAWHTCPNFRGWSIEAVFTKDGLDYWEMWDGDSGFVARVVACPFCGEKLPSKPNPKWLLETDGQVGKEGRKEGDEA